MAVPYSNVKLRPPMGFRNLLEGLTREILRNQPDNIPEFSAVFFEHLVKLRDAGEYDPMATADPAEFGGKIEDRYYNDGTFQETPLVDVNDPEAMDAVLTIQASFRGYQARKEMQYLASASETAAIAEEQHHAKGLPEGVVVPEGMEDIDFDSPEVQDAVARLQAGAKGYLTRKRKAKQSTQETTVVEVHQESSEHTEVELAATVIQSAFRGYYVRKYRKTIERTVAVEITQTTVTTSEHKATLEGVQIPEGMEDIDFDSPEVQDAVAKLQAGAKGYLAKKRSKQAKPVDWDKLKEELPLTPEARKELFKLMDRGRGNKKLSLSEVEEGLKKVTPEIYKCREAVKLAFQVAKELSEDGGADNEFYITRTEFKSFVYCLRVFYECSVAMTRLEEGSITKDGKLTRAEFGSCVEKLQEWGLTVDDPDEVFNKIDTDESGVIGFGEFCRWSVCQGLDLPDDDDLDYEMEGGITEQQDAEQVGETTEEHVDATTVVETELDIAEKQEDNDVVLDDNNETRAEDTAELPAEDTAELPAEDTAELPAEDTMELPAEDTAELPAEDTAELPAEDTAELPAEDTAELPAEDTMELPAEDTAELPAEDTAELPAEDTAELPAEDTAELPAEDTAELPKADTSDPQPDVAPEDQPDDS